MQGLTHNFVNSTDDTRIFYERFGEGSSILLCDGLLCKGHVWKYLSLFLSKKYNCVHWHYPGHGKSSVPPESSSLSPCRLADDAANVLRDSEISRATIIAHSLGVQVALELYNRHPDLVNGLVLICGAPGRLTESFYKSDVLKFLLPLLNFSSQFLPRHVSKIWHLLPTNTLASLVERSGEINSRLIKMSDLAPYLEGINQVDFNVALKMLEAAGRHDATPFLHKLNIPVLIMAGQKDRFTPVKFSKKMADLILNAELIISQEGTHSLPLEQPDLVNLRINQFLNERIGG